MGRYIPSDIVHHFAGHEIKLIQVPDEETCLAKCLKCNQLWSGKIASIIRDPFSPTDVLLNFQIWIKNECPKGGETKKEEDLLFVR